jgi:hypothetical protein
LRCHLKPLISIAIPPSLATTFSHLDNSVIFFSQKEYVSSSLSVKDPIPKGPPKWFSIIEVLGNFLAN